MNKKTKKMRLFRVTINIQTLYYTISIPTLISTVFGSVMFGNGYHKKASACDDHIGKQHSSGNNLAANISSEKLPKAPFLISG